jgi:hypothetical protein
MVVMMVGGGGDCSDTLIVYSVCLSVCLKIGAIFSGKYDSPSYSIVTEAIQNALLGFVSFR